MLNKINDGRSQNRLMAIVCLSRLVPFVSFDAVSYVAGLTPIAFWRFGVATVLGAVPVSFALAYFGDQLLDARADEVILYLLLAGGITIIPFGIRALMRVLRPRPRQP